MSSFYLYRAVASQINIKNSTSWECCLFCLHGNRYSCIEWTPYPDFWYGDNKRIKCLPSPLGCIHCAKVWTICLHVDNQIIPALLSFNSTYRWRPHSPFYSSESIQPSRLQCYGYSRSARQCRWWSVYKDCFIWEQW